MGAVGFEKLVFRLSIGISVWWSGLSVENPFIKRVTILLSFWAGQMPEDSVCFLTRSEPNNTETISLTIIRG